MCVDSTSHNHSMAIGSDLATGQSEVLENESLGDKLLCPHCDLLVKLPPLRAEHRADCPRCKTTLSRWTNRDRATAGYYALCALFMLALAMAFPFISIRVSGIFSQIKLIEITEALLSDKYTSIALLFVILIQLVPAFCMLSVALLCFNVQLPQMLKKNLAKALYILKPWCMVEIFLIGVLVSFVKLMAYGDIGLGQSFLPYCLFCLLQIKAFQSLDLHWLWNRIEPIAEVTQEIEVGQTGIAQGLRSCRCCQAILPAGQLVCSRCYTPGHVRRKYSLQWTMALLITSLMLYIPANILPIMTTVALGKNIDSTIISGVLLLWDDGSYPVAMVIFIASIMVPSLKMISIIWLCLYAKGKGRLDSERTHIIYNIVEFVGRWSMIDIFVIAVLAALLHFGNLMAVYPAIGSLFFASVVILTMISAIMYDPRFIWDRIPVLIQKESAGAGR